MIPSVDELLRDPAFAPLIAAWGRALIKERLRVALAALRRRVADDGAADPAPAAIAANVSRDIEALMAPGLRAVFNLTGTILHTNLGRAPLPDVAIAAMIDAAGAVNLEYDLDGGCRGRRDTHLENWLIRLTGAARATALNNNAAAVMIALNTLAPGREVIVSRGELIEIGGAFRLPDIMARAGCILREVGTTNRTHLRDYQGAITPQTALILQVHTSNYQVQGFTKSVATATLAKLAHAHDLALIADLGSGTLIDLRRFGLPAEPTAREILEQGADLVTFSGDKLLGGPQAGILAGRADLVARITQNPMARAMRPGKITIAALAAVLRLYADPERLAERLPTLGLLTRSADDIGAQAARLCPPARAALQGVARVAIVPCRSQIGSGAMPVDLLDSFALELTPATAADRPLRALARALRHLPRPVIGRVRNGTVLLDLRALSDEAAFISQLDRLGGILDLGSHPRPPKQKKTPT